jgi:3-hydroxyisobutyrate dehydrogenase-like beta-hydroxyacid dehydrogenase
VSAFYRLVCGIVVEEGFRVNGRKTRRMRRGERQRVTGLVVNERLNVPRDAYERARPNLLDIGPKVTHVGEEHGLALAMKIAVNLNLQVQMQAFCEAVLLAEKAGVPRETAVEILSLDTAADVYVNTVVTSPMVKYRGPFVLKIPEVAWFNVNMMQKDMNLALDMGQRLNVPLLATALCNEFLTAARAMGLAHHDMAIVFDVLAALAGVEVER